MCGIVGFLAAGPRDARHKIVQQMADSLMHRGPDDEGIRIDDCAALGVRRLSIIDPPGGHQPIANEDGTVWVVSNGEIYNFPALREELEGRGHRFRTRSDTEVIVHAYEEYGEDCLAHLDGMFAFAIWDANERLLLLARDRMGEKPLHYYAGPDTFVFGSELRALLAHPATPRDLSLRSLSRYLAFEYVPAPYSIVAGVAKLPPGHLLTVRPGRAPRVTRYWDLSFAPDSSVSEPEWTAEIVRQLERSVKRQLVADVPVGFFLSGGVDSSAIVAMAARARPALRLRTFAIGFAEASYDERPFAAEVARRLGAEHADLVFSSDDAVRLLDTVGSLLDEPLVDGSFLPTYVLSKLARQSVTVALSGDGGDELFCGYPTFLAERGASWFRRLPRPLRRVATAAIASLPPSRSYGSVEFLLKKFVRGAEYGREVRTQLLLGGLMALEQQALFSSEVRAACARFDLHDELTTMLEDAPGATPVDRLISQHCRCYLAEQNLVTVDRASMACGFEVRAPFLDRPLVELTGRIPAALKLRGWTTKYILRQALRPYLPASILARRKQGFGVPIGLWLRGPLRSALEERLAPARIERAGLFDSSAVGRLVREHVAGQNDHRKILWALMMLDAWCERYVPHARWTAC